MFVYQWVVIADLPDVQQWEITYSYDQAQRIASKFPVGTVVRIFKK